MIELVMGWTFSAERFQPQTITELADAYLGELQSLIEHCLRDDAGGLTPSDFPLERIKQRLRAELPEYMVPLHWLWLDKLSLNANGKLDRKALPALEIGQIQSLDSQAPRSELEQTHTDRLTGAESLAEGCAAAGDVRVQHGGGVAGYIDGQAASEMTVEKVDRLNDLMAEREGLRFSSVWAGFFASRLAPTMVCVEHV